MNTKGTSEMSNWPIKLVMMNVNQDWPLLLKKVVWRYNLWILNKK